jgi:predicted membrane protein
MKNNVKTIIGIALLLLGTLLLIDRTGFVFPFAFSLAEILRLFWPLIIVAFGIKLLVDKNITWGLIVTTLGLLFLLTNIFDWNFFALLWPLILVGIGLSILFRKESSTFGTSSEEYNDNRIQESFSFTDSKRKITSKSFTGGEVSVSFGQLDLDLREAQIDKKGAKLEATVAFGEINIYVPKNCRVVTKGSVFLGSWEPKLKESTVQDPVLEITGSANFGELAIKD